MPLLTVFTPTYNRAHTLMRTYESLLRQSCKDFVWLIIDDGSADNTHKLVEEWQHNDNGFEIRYLYKENGGMHTAHNVAYENIDTELNVCIDSDDVLAEDAVSKIKCIWSEVRDAGYAGIVGLDADFNGQIIGTRFPKNYAPTTLSRFYANGGKGDKKIVCSTKVIKQYPPYPEFKGERLVPLSYKFIFCEQDYEFFAVNEVLSNVEYQSDGSTNNIWAQYLQSPRGFAAFRKIRMQYPRNIKGLLIDCVHYVSSSLMSDNKRFIAESPRKVLTVLAIPCGLVLMIYIKSKVARIHGRGNEHHKRSGA